MGRLPYNVERHPAIKGAHIAYDKNGFAFRVQKRGKLYYAHPSYAGASGDKRYFVGETLREIGMGVASSH